MMELLYECPDCPLLFELSQLRDHLIDYHRYDDLEADAVVEDK